MSPPKYVPKEEIVSVMAYVKARNMGKQFHARRFEVIVPIDRTAYSFQGAWRALYNTEWHLMGMVMPIETDTAYTFDKSANV